MVTLRFRYQNGTLIPLDPLPGWREGQGVHVEWNPTVSPTDDDIARMLEQTRGLWADWEENVEELIDDARKKWDQEWQDRLSSS